MGRDRGVGRAVGTRGYEYTTDGESITIKAVPVNLYVPTVIKLVPNGRPKT